MQSLPELMSMYQSHHTKDSTKMSHFFGVPCIMLALQILLSWPHISLFSLNNISFAWIAAISLLVYYLILDVSLAVITAIFLLPLTYLAQLIAQDQFNLFAFSLFCILFMVGWTAQLIGHYYEGSKPAFLDNLFQVFVAPIFLVAELVFALGYRKELQKRVLELAHKPAINH